MVPWLFCIPSTFLGKWLTEKLITQGHSVTYTRKINEVICLGFQALGLILIGEIFVISCTNFMQNDCLRLWFSGMWCHVIQ
jgi:hypothetical protein